MMAKIPSVVKIKKDGVEYISSVARSKFLLSELTRAALKDVGKFLRRRIRDAAPKDTGNIKANIATWVKTNRYTKEIELEVGYYSKAAARKKGKKSAFYARYFEFGTKKMAAKPFFTPTVMNNIDEIRRIEGQYLSTIENENRALGLIKDNQDEEVSDK